MISWTCVSTLPRVMRLSVFRLTQQAWVCCWLGPHDTRVNASRCFSATSFCVCTQTNNMLPWVEIDPSNKLVYSLPTTSYKFNHGWRHVYFVFVFIWHAAGSGLLLSSAHLHKATMKTCLTTVCPAQIFVNIFQNGGDVIQWSKNIILDLTKRVWFNHAVSQH